MITGCSEILKAPVAYPSPVKPIPAMEPCNKASFFEEMKIAVQGQGIREDWLMDYAARAEKCNINHSTLVEFLGEMK